MIAAVGLTVAAFPFALLAPIPASLLAPSVFLTGAAVWWAAMPEDDVSLCRGAMAGAATGLLSHFTFWLAVVVNEAVHGSPVGDPVESVVASGILSVLGIVVVGVVTVPIGAIAGVLLAYAQSHREPAWRGNDEAKATGR